MVDKGIVQVMTPYGPVCVYAKDDCISATIKGGQFWDGPLLLPFYDKYARAGEVAIDIGSFCGISALYLARKGCKVIAVEPVHHELVRGTVLANGLMEQVTVLSGAAYNEACWLIAAPDKVQGQKVAGLKPGEIDNPGGVALQRATQLEARDVECVQAFILDRWVDLGEKVCLVKSDAQGCDLRALKGLRATIARCQPAILFEYEGHLAELHQDTWKDYEEFFDGLGYKIEEQDGVGYAHNYVAVPR